MAAGSRGKVLARYTLFQIPDLILLGLARVVAVRWWGLSLPAAWLIFAFWIVKDIVLYPVIRIAYRTDGSAADRLGLRSTRIPFLDDQAAYPYGSPSPGSPPTKWTSTSTSAFSRDQRTLSAKASHPVRFIIWGVT